MSSGETIDGRTKKDYDFASRDEGKQVAENSNYLTAKTTVNFIFS